MMYMYWETHLLMEKFAAPMNTVCVFGIHGHEFKI